MLWVEDDIRRLVEQLTESLHRGRGAKLTSKVVNIALVALRAHRDKLTSPPVTAAIVSFQIEARDGVGLLKEVLAITIDERVARATLASARRRFPGQEIMLRGKTSSGDKIDLAV